MQRSINEYSSSACSPSTGAPINGVAAEADDEHANLRAELAAAKERVVKARLRTELREAEARETLRAEIVSTREVLAEIERQYRQAVSMIQATARAEVERVLAPGSERTRTPDVA